MSLYGTRVGRISTQRDDGQAVCPRCGRLFPWSGRHLVVGAPCSDCREVLRDEGDTTIWDTRSPEYRAQQRARAREGAAA